MCRHCGASNAPSVDWCGQCYMSFVTANESAAPPESEMSWPAAQPGQWTCIACETGNDVEAAACTACRTSIFDAIAPSEAAAAGPLTRSAFIVPGLALNRVGKSIEGSLVMLLAASSVIAGVIIPSLVARLVALLFLAALWFLSVRDATSTEPVLTIAVLRWVMVGFGSAILLSFLILSAIGSQAS